MKNEPEKSEMTETSLIDEVEQTIRAVCRRVQERDCMFEYEAEVINALAKLLEARVLMVR